MNAELEKQKRLTPEENMMIVLELASGKFKQKDIALRHGISDQRVSKIKQENEQLFNDVRNARLESITAEQIKQQEWRLTQLARDMEKLDNNWHPESVKARTGILKHVAEELGQIAEKTINIRPVETRLIGINPDEDL